MPWYKTGTVSVTLNSNAVIGTGTAFLVGARIGDAFRGPDGAWYEITGIVSDTALSIAPNYQGATKAAGVYAFAPLQGYVKDSADALRSLVNTYGSKLAAMGTAAAVDIQTNVTDPVTGRAMLNGAWGWGSVAADNPTDLNAIGVSQKFGVNTGALNTPWALGSTTVPFAAGSSGIAMTWTPNHQSQIIVNRTAPMVALRRKNAGVWAADDYFCMYPTGKSCLSVEQGGTGGKTQAEARSGLGLGTAATVNIGRQAGQVLGVPFLGLGSREDVGNSSLMGSMNVWETSVGVIADVTQYKPIAFGTVLNMSFPGTGFLGSQLYMSTSPGKILGFRSGDYSTESFNIVYHTGNTTRAADGTLKGI